MGEVATLVARPPGLPAEIADADLLQAVREFMFGADWQTVATMLSVTVQKLHAITRTTQWSVLQNNFHAEFMATEGSRMVRLQRKLMDKLEKQVDEGIESTSTDENGVVYKHMRQMSPKEAVSIALMLNDTNKRLDKIKEGEVTRKDFDANEMMRGLKRFASAKTIDVEPDAATG